MRSDQGRWAWLRSQGLGVICGLSTTLLLAVGSFVLAATRDGASAGIGMDDLRGFFTPPALAHAWLYLLLPVVALYALNTLYATLDSVVRKVRAGVRRPSAYAAAVMHVAFLVAMAAHGVAGVFGEEGPQVTIGDGWTPVGDRQARLVGFELEQLPNGMPKRVRALVETDDGARAEVGYNAPLSFGLGSELWLLADSGHAPSGATLALGWARCTVAIGGTCQLGERQVDLLALTRAGLHLRVRSDEGQVERWAVPGRPVALAAGQELLVAGIESRPAIVLRGRYTPGHPVALASALLLVLGAGLLWRRLV